MSSGFVYEKRTKDNNFTLAFTLTALDRLEEPC